MPDTLLSTKLYIPRPRGELVPRPRLIGRLDAGLRGKLTLVSAPAGYGKTTLVSDWITRSQVRVAWLSLEASDNDLARFLGYLIAALQGIDEGIGLDVQAILGESHAPAVEGLLTQLVNEIEAAANGPLTMGPGSRLAKGPEPGEWTGPSFVLVLDDYHVITAPPIHDALCFLLDHLPPPPGGLHLVIVGRADPPLPISRLRVQGEVTEIRTAELRFTTHEVAAFLNDRMGLDLSPADIAALETRTEGWVASLQLAALSLQGRQDRSEFVTAFSGSHHHVIDYLVDEVMARQPIEIRAFLRQTSILDRFCAPLCDAVCFAAAKAPGAFKGSASQQILHQLERTNLFLVPLDDGRRWYRYHHLFASFLSQRLRAQEPARIAELHRRASQWYEGEGVMEQAIEHALVAGDLERATRLVDRIAPSLFVRREPAKLLKWIDPLPLELRQGYPILCVSHAWVLFFDGQLDAIEPILRIAEANQDQAPQSPIAGYANTIRAYVANMRGDLPKAIELSELALAQMSDAPPERTTLIHQGAAILWLAVNYRHLGDLAGASRLFQQALSLNQRARSIYAALASMEQLGDLAVIQGQLHRAADLYRRGLQMAQTWTEQEERGRGALLASVFLHLRLGSVLYQWNDLTGAAPHVRRHVELLELDDAWERMLGYKLLAYLKQAEGDTQAAVDLLDKARTIRERLSVRHVNALAEPGFVQLQILLGRSHASRAHLLTDVAQWIETQGLWPDDAGTESVASPIDFASPTGYAREPEYSDLARSLIALDRAAEAMPLLERLLKAARSMGRQGDEIRYLTQQALGFHAQGETASALDSLDQALTLGEPEGYVRLFVDAGEPMATLLRQVAARGVSLDYVGRLLAAFRGSAQNRDTGDSSVVAHTNVGRLSTPTQPWDVEPLSERELEVLRLMARGLKHGEVAEQLYISLNTIRYHARNIYGKLNVNTRAQAINRAKQLNLL